MIELEKTKSLPITKEMVWEAYLEVRRKGKSAGVDDLSMSQYDLQRHRHLYKVWNRLASGSYFPPPVLQVEIPKKNGSIRQLGIPTISDRVAQTVIKNQMEERLEQIFHPQSYGTDGTPQGGVISPLLANLFLHYTLDVWLGRLNPTIEIVRYADDIIIHCQTQSQAEQSLQQIKERVENCGLTLHPDKTKIVYCKDFRRQQKYQKVQFDFLGYTFQPRTSKSKKTGRLFLGFDCAISI